jgi:glycosyltransferase 2 family protein
MASKTKSRLALILKVAIAAALIAYMVHAGHLDPKDLWDMLTVQNVLLAVGIVGLNLFLAAYRWIILLRARDFNIGIGYGFALYLIGIFFNFALPGGVGGDVVRGYYLVADHPNRKMDAVLSIVIDRVLGLYSFFILTLVAVAWDYEFVASHEKIRWVAVSCAFVCAGMTAFFTVAFSERLSGLFGLTYLARRIMIVDRLLVAFQRFGKNKAIIALSVVVSFLAQLAAMIFFYQMALIAGETDITWKAVLFVVPMGFLVSALPIAPAGIGVGQVAFAYLFQAYLQKTTQFGATAITAFQLTLVCWALVGAVFYLRRRKPHELECAET